MVQCIEFTKALNICTLSADDAFRANLREQLTSLGMSNVEDFTSGRNLVNYAATRGIGLLICSTEIKDLQWLNLLRVLRTHLDLAFVPAVFVHAQEVLDEQPVASQYDVQGLLPASFSKQDLKELLKRFIITERHSHSITSRLRIAKNLCLHGIPAQARGIYQLIIDEHPEILPAHFGIMQTCMDDQRAFVEHLDFVLANDPENYFFRFELLTHDLRMNHRSRLASSFEDLLGCITGNDANFWLSQLGQHVLSLRLHRQAEKVANQLLSRTPADPGSGYLLRARNLLALGHSNEAMATALLAVKQDGSSKFEALNLVGMIHRRLGEPALAIEAFEEAFSLSPYDHRIAYNAALAMLDLSMRAKAVSYLKKAIELRPDYERAVAKLRELSHAA